MQEALFLRKEYYLIATTISAKSVICIFHTLSVPMFDICLPLAVPCIRHSLKVDFRLVLARYNICNFAALMLTKRLSQKYQTRLFFRQICRHIHCACNLCWSPLASCALFRCHLQLLSNLSLELCLRVFHFLVANSVHIVCPFRCIAFSGYHSTLRASCSDGNFHAIGI